MTTQTTTPPLSIVQDIVSGAAKLMGRQPDKLLMTAVELAVRRGEFNQGKDAFLSAIERCFDVADNAASSALK